MKGVFVRLKEINLGFVPIVAVISALGIFLSFTNVARASENGSLYTYNLSTVNGTTVANTAQSNTTVALNLYGNWELTNGGLNFDGNLTDKQSVGYAKPLSGNTINVLATESFGGAIKFVYKAPAAGTCFKDSNNLSQIGRFAAKTAQLKIQLSSCGGSKTAVYPECRVAGALTPTTVLPVRGTQALVDGNQYVLSCIKSADPATGLPTVVLETTQLNVEGNVATTNTFSVAKTGVIKTTAYLSVANKYTLPAISKNTDQYVGTINVVSFCKLTTVDEVRYCLNTEVPLGL